MEPEHGSCHSGLEYLHQQARPFQLLLLLPEQPDYLHCILLRLFAASTYAAKICAISVPLTSLVSPAPV